MPMNVDISGDERTKIDKNETIQKINVTKNTSNKEK